VPAALNRWLRLSSLTVYRLVTWSLLAAAFTLAALILGLRYWILPNMDQHRETIARMIERGVGQRIAIGRVAGNWGGLHPELVLENVTIFDGAGRPALRLARIYGELSWFSIAALEPRFRSVELSEPDLGVRRDAAGRLYVAGVELKEGEGGGLGDWLLRQRSLSVRNAQITWHDEQRGAPPLELKAVDLVLRNRGERHRFAMRAHPPQMLAGPLEVRGELHGRSLSETVRWHGRLFVQVDGVDIRAWSTWLPASITLPKGIGAVRMWSSFREERLSEITADVRLAKVEIRLAPELPELELAALSGRVGWKNGTSGLEVSTTGLALVTGSGLTVQPTDFLLRLSGGDGSAARGELRANTLALGPLAALAEHLPLEAELRNDLIALAPRGRLFDVSLRWNGSWRAPSQYIVRGRFEGLGISGSGVLPGFAGLTGAVEGNEKSGVIRLDSSGVTLDLPKVFRGPLELEALAADIAWSHASPSWELRFAKVTFSNGHLAGTVSGMYRTVPDARGVIDVTGHLSRADARYVAHYVPLLIGQGTRDWLDRALVSGQSKDVSLRVKGDLTGFPFPEGKGGVFEVLAKVTGGVLDYAPGWPRIENIAGEVAFRGKRMEVNAREGTILGTKLVKVRAEIPDLVDHYEILNIAGEAEGPSAEFLGFIEKSPVLDMIDRFTEGMRLQGGGKLALKLVMPLRATEKSRVSGVYQFSGNRLVMADVPPIEQASGRLEFTEASVRVPNATATFLGGPIVVTSAPAGDASARLNVQGRTPVEGLRQAAGVHPWMRHLGGAADWRGTLTLRRKLADLVIESTLAGVASELPAPFNKAAAQEVPLRIERRFIGQTQGLTERIEVSYGEIASARVVRRHGDGKDVISRGTVRFGGPAPEPERDGIWVSGTLNRLDADQWLALATDSPGKVEARFAGIDVKLGELRLMNRAFHDVALAGSVQDGGWRANLAAREFEGTAHWEAQERGKLTARLKRLVIPAPLAEEKRDEPARGRELPGLDIVAEHFQFKDKGLGRLELAATPVERDWRIDRLRISNPDGVLTVNGLVREMATRPRTRGTMRLEVGDIGKFLARLGYPEGVRRGTAQLEGTLAWPGAPHDFELSALSGNLKLDAAKGQFVKLEPGIGKFLGILSLQALPRRATLDFRDIFTEGFAFDQIAGDLAIERGIVTTDNFRIQGPAARVAMSGEVDLAKESQRLRVRIVPSLSDSVSIAGALIGGPVAGVATILAQKILKDPLDQIFAYEYSVTGTWTEPQVSKIDRPAPAATEAQ